MPKRKAANQLDTSPKNIIENIERLAPNTKASSELIFSFGRGLPLVRSIKLSISLSHHMFKAPAAPAPIDMQSNIMRDRNKLFSLGDIIIPTAAVNTESHITLGFKRAYKSSNELFASGSTFSKVFN